MDIFKDYLNTIQNSAHRERIEYILKWITHCFPDLKPRIAWNQPMFTDHGTFIIGFSVSKKHLAVGPEKASIDHFSKKILESGYTHTKQLFRINWDMPVDFSLLEQIIAFNIADKALCSNFWRK